MAPTPVPPMARTLVPSDMRRDDIGLLLIFVICLLDFLSMIEGDCLHDGALIKVKVPIADR